MDLDEMKAVWSDLGDQLEKQKKLNQDLIMKMTQEKSSSRLGRIIRMELFGITVSGIILVYLIANFAQLTNWPALAGGIGMAIILGIAIVFGAKIILKARKIDLIKNTYNTVIDRFNEFRAMLKFYKKLSIWTNAFSIICVIPVTYTLFLKENILDNLEGAGISLLMGFVLAPIVLYLTIRFYSRNMSQVKKALNDIDFKDQ
ncbi:MAG: hypothetical protein HEP71_00355 [Roseivirga sp.]|nr:hypothetical protein [Roseivirga sp.]